MNIIPQNKLVQKVLLLFCFSLLLLIPLSFIKDIISERSDLYELTNESIGAEWGQPQRISGPAIVVPYLVRNKLYETITDENGRIKKIEKTDVVRNVAIILPDKLTAVIDLQNEERKRGIYKSTVYTAAAELSGVFTFNLAEILPKNSEPNYDSIFVAQGISDTKALLRVSEFKFGADNLDLLSGTQLDTPYDLTKGISGMLKIDKKGNNVLPYSIKMEFRGSNNISILPVSMDNNISITSSWNSPSFFGVLPDTRNISEKGFDSSWNVSHLIRNYPQVFNANSIESLREAEIGVTLFENVTHYRQVIRAVKYGYLFITLSLLAMLIFEIASGKVAHYLQYGIVGASLVMFYLLLLSISEHLSFPLAYAISACAVILPVSIYTMSIIEDKRYGGGMFSPHRSLSYTFLDT